MPVESAALFYAIRDTSVAAASTDAAAIWTSYYENRSAKYVLDREGAIRNVA